MVRTVENWKKILAPMAADPMPKIARRVLGDLTHYLEGRTYESDDCKTLANAILAWGQLGRE